MKTPLFLLNICNNIITLQTLSRLCGDKPVKLPCTQTHPSRLFLPPVSIRRRLNAPRVSALHIYQPRAAPHRYVRPNDQSQTEMGGVSPLQVGSKFIRDKANSLCLEPAQTCHSSTK